MKNMPKKHGYDICPLCDEPINYDWDYCPYDGTNLNNPNNEDIY